MDDRFFQAWYPANVRIFGRRLKPFCLAHWLHLAALRSPLLASDEPVSVGDLLTAVRICSRQRMTLRFGRPGMMDRIRAGFSRRNPLYFQQQAALFVKYLEAGSQGPKFWEKSEVVIPKERLPWILAIATNLLHSTSLSEEEVWFMPLGKALWYHAAIAVREGANLDILSTEEEALLEALRDERNWEEPS